MRNTRDEILYKMATDIKDLDLSRPIPVPIPEPPRFETQEMQPEVDWEKFTHTKRTLDEFDNPPNVPSEPIEVPKEDKPEELPKEDEQDPLAKRFFPGETDGEGPNPNAPEGSPEWYAYHNTREFLKGTQLRYRGEFRHDPGLTRKTMDWLVKENPENYFRWDLNRRSEFKPWLIAAAESWVEKSPHSALLARVYRLPELRTAEFTTRLWDRMMEAEMDRAAETETGQMFPGEFRRFMRQLAGVIATSDPDFYMEKIYGKPLSSKQHDRTFEAMKSRSEALHRLIKIADGLDKAGEFALASELDNIVREFISNPNNQGE